MRRDPEYWQQLYPRVWWKPESWFYGAKASRLALVGLVWLLALTTAVIWLAVR